MQATGSSVVDKFVDPADRNGEARPPRPSDWKPIEDVLGLLARAIQQLHTYPSGSPMCVGAIEACQRAVSGLSRDQLTFRITPAEVLVDDVTSGRGSAIGAELAKRLHRAGVASVTIERAASAREIGRFCEDLVRCGEKSTPVPLIDMLTEHGLERIGVTMASTPEVLQVGTIPDEVEFDLARTRARFSSQLAKGGVVNHLYPPQKGWVRVDPSVPATPVSLLDLAVLAEDPGSLASMLLRLTDEGRDVPPAEALDRKYSDVALLISGLDPTIARRMFGKLARAVLDLTPDRRQALLRRTVLPGLLDGRIDGAILRDFPDVDLAESLCLLLDLETAAPELLATALSRLELSPDRQASVMPLLDERLRARESEEADGERQNTLARHARELMRVDGREGKSFAEFAAFDLALDAAALATLEDIRSAVPASDLPVDQLACLWHLICLEPNPEAVNVFLGRSFALLDALERGHRGAELPGWLAGYRQLADRLRDTRPDVSTVIDTHLSAFCTPARAGWIVDMALAEPGGRQAASSVVGALGPAVVAPLVDILTREASGASGVQARGRAVQQLLTEHAAVLGPGVPAVLQHANAAVARTLLRVLGASGAGHEDLIAGFVRPDDEQTGREALRALARLGTTKAADLVVAQIASARGALGLAAEETLWHFPAAEAQRQARALLGRREFTIGHPDATGRLLDRVARNGVAGLEPVLLGLAPLRFRVWKPALARVARKAHGMLNRS